MALEKATNLDQIPNVFLDYPLDGADLDRFYRDTIEIRTGESGLSPMRFLYRACTTPSGRNAHLLMGHRGCGKSTELNKLRQQFEKAGYPVRTINCSRDLDRSNTVYSDIIVLMAEALVNLAEERHCSLKDGDLKLLERIYQEIEKVDESARCAELEVTGGAEVESPKLLSGFLRFFLALKDTFKFNQETRTVVREKVQNRVSDWLRTINSIADTLSQHSGGKQPILIFEDLDKGNTWDIFHMHCEQLTATRFPTIFTFPIGLSYSPEFSEIEGFFEYRRLPMIKTRNRNGKINRPGVAVIRSIVETRAEPTLFSAEQQDDMDVLDYLIDKTGGSLRDLFRCIREAAFIATERNQPCIGFDTAKIALRELKSDLKIRIDTKDYPFLREIHVDHSQYSDKPSLLKMMQAGVVLEYNGESWYNLHPLIEDFLRENRALEVISS